MTSPVPSPTTHDTKKLFAWGLPALGAFLFPLGLVVASIVALFTWAGQTAQSGGMPFWRIVTTDIYVQRAVIFTLTQAFLSAFFSTLLAIPLARALAHRTFPGRQVMLSLFGAPFILPVIVAILGLLAIWGNSGLINQLLTATSFDTISIFGLSGILLAHVFFNLPLATRLLLQGWLTIPQEQWRLAAQLGMSSRTIARHIEAPMLKERVPGAFAIIFLLCVTSFTVVLALGGGPKATTIELAIYQAIRYDFDLDRAALLATAQIIICALLALVSRFVAKDHDTGQSLGGHIPRPDLTHPLNKLIDTLVILSAILFLSLPLLAAFLRGALALMEHGIDVRQMLPAILRSLIVALGATAIMLAISLPLAQLSLHLKGNKKRLIELPGYAIMVAPPIALGAGLFILLHTYIPVDSLALPLTSLLNGLQAVPFALLLLVPNLQQTRSNYGHLMDHLGLTGWLAIKHIYWPQMRKAIGLSLGITAALSIGDLGVIALFGSPTEPTLPLYLYQQMGAYRMDQAYASGLILTILAFLLFLTFDRGLGGHD